MGQGSSIFDDHFLLHACKSRVFGLPHTKADVHLGTNQISFYYLFMLMDWCSRVFGLPLKKKADVHSKTHRPIYFLC